MVRGQAESVCLKRDDVKMSLGRLIFASFALAMTIPHARSQELGDLSKGRNLAQQVCAACHAVQPQEAPSPNSEAPAFAAIASTPGMTATALNAFLHTPHRSMPNFILEAAEMNDIVVYILSLKK